MLPSVQRLTRKKDFDLVFLDGKSSKGAFLIFKYMKNQRPSSRVGFVVSKKVSLKASVRNAVKRRLRTAFTRELDVVKPHYDIVVIALPLTKEKTFQEIQATVHRFLKHV